MSNTRLNPHEIQLVQSSFAALEGRLPELVELFYADLFGKNPQVRRMFPIDMADQRKKLAAALKLAVGGASDLEKLVPSLTALGAKHASYGVTAGQFDAVGASLLTALGQAAGPLWTAELKAAWARTYALIASVMIDAMEKQRARQANEIRRSGQPSA